MGRSRKLREGVTFLRMGNGARVAAKTLRDVYLLLNNSFKFIKRCFVCTFLVKNIISISIVIKMDILVYLAKVFATFTRMNV